MPGMLGEEALLADAGRRAKQAERASHNMRENPFRDVGIELSEALFGDPGLLLQDTFRMGEPYAREISGGLLLFRCSGRRHLQGDVGGGLVLAQALERGV